MALETTKTTYLNGSSKDGGRVLANFSSSLSESGTMTINETISDNANLDTLDTVEADFNEFRELAKNELKKINSQDTEADVPSDKSGDKEATTTTSDNEAVKDDKPVDTATKADSKPETDVSSDKTGDKEVVATTPDSEPVDATTKVDDKPETDTPDEAKASGVKDSEETKEPVSPEEIKQPVVSEETKQPDSPVSPASTEETKQPVVSKEVKVSDVKDGENVDESN